MYVKPQAVTMLMCCFLCRTRYKVNTHCRKSFMYKWYTERTMKKAKLQAKRTHNSIDFRAQLPQFIFQSEIYLSLHTDIKFVYLKLSGGF